MWVFHWEQKKRLKNGAVRRQQYLNGVEKEKFQTQIKMQKEVHGIYREMLRRQIVLKKDDDFGGK